jgi:hypothetical protein
MESKRSRPFKLGRLVREDDWEAGKIEGSSSSSDFDKKLDSSLWRIRVRVSGGQSLLQLRRSAAGSTVVLEVKEFVDWRLRELERDGRLLLEVEVEVDADMIEDNDESPDWSDFREILRSDTVVSGVTERLLVSFALLICGSRFKEASTSADVLLATSRLKSLGGSGVVEGQLERELSSEDLTVGVLAREFEVVVFVERDLEERRGSCMGSVCCEGEGRMSSSMTSTTLPSGATTS